MNHIKDTFLAGLQEHLHTTLALIDFSQQTIEQVVAHVLAIDRAQHKTSFSMGSPQNALPPQEETQLQQALQCMECSNSGHLAVEFPHRPHYPICHSPLHTVEQCEYNMLNRTATGPVRQIEPSSDRSR